MSSFKEGFDTFVRINGANLGASVGDNYVSDVNSSINNLLETLRDPPRNIQNIDIDQAKGFAAEWWHEGTFNIDAALKGNDVRANAPDNNGVVDIFLSDGGKAQIKYYKTGEASAKAQSQTRDGKTSYYSDQTRLIPADQIRDAEKWLERKIAEESSKRPELVQRYQDTLDNLRDRLESDGVDSIPLDEETAKDLARAMREDGLDPADFGLTTEILIEFDHIMNQAFKAGLTAALISVALQVGPQVCGIICKLIKDGEVDIDEFKQLGFSALSGGSEGFIRGSVAAAITVSCKAGLLGTVLKAANPSIIGAVVAISMNCIQNSCLLAFGKINQHEYASRCAQDLFVTSFSISFGIAGAAITALTPATPIIGFMIGSLVGSVVGTFVHKGVYSCTMAFCVESGCTFFGIVDQNYEIPSDVLNSMGLDVFEYEKIELKHFTPDTSAIKKFKFDKFEPINIDIKYLRRGVIGVGIVGYI